MCARESRGVAVNLVADFSRHLKKRDSAKGTVSSSASPMPLHVLLLERDSDDHLSPMHVSMQ